MGAGLLASCESFDPAAGRWSSSFAEIRRARWGHGCASLGGLVYAVGGCSLRPNAPPREAFMETLGGCEVYEPANDSWSPCASLRVARAGSRVVVLGDRYLAAVGGCEDVFGRAEMLTSVELYDPGAAMWALLDVQLSTPRTTAAVAALDEQHILVFGGAPSLASTEVYSVPRRTEADACGGSAATTTESSPMTVATSSAPSSDRDSGSTELAGTDSSAAGGSGGEFEASPVATIAMSCGELAEGRMGCQAVALDLPASGSSFPLCTRPCVVVVGGENGDEDLDARVRQFSSVLVYDVEAKAWRPEGAFPPIPTPRTAMAICVGPGRVEGHY